MSLDPDQIQTPEQASVGLTQGVYTNDGGPGENRGLRLFVAVLPDGASWEPQLGRSPSPSRYSTIRSADSSMDSSPVWTVTSAFSGAS